jgi:hypothetical protein
MWRSWNTHTLLVMMKSGAVVRVESSGSSKHNTELSYDPVIQLLGIYPKELRIRTQSNTCMPTITAAIVTTDNR